MEVYLHSFFNEAIGGGERLVPNPRQFNSEGTTPSSIWKGGRVEPIAGLETLDKRKVFLLWPGIDPRSLG
jgi:hypothetical protein